MERSGVVERSGSRESGAERRGEERRGEGKGNNGSRHCNALVQLLLFEGPR